MVTASPTRPTEAELTAFRERVRAFIAEYAPPIEAREGHRAPVDAAQAVAVAHMVRRPVRCGLHRCRLARRIRRPTRPPPDARPDRQRGDPAGARAPPVDQVNLAAHVLLHFGSEAQKQACLPPIRSSEHVWCQLLSEPDAGSDIAAIRSRAVRQPDGTWLLDGQKTWITDGHWADMGLALIRTDPSSLRHHGLSVFVVPLSAPGVEVRPIRTIGDAIEVNEVFLTDVRLPADSLIGEVGQGWSIIMAGLDFERFGIGGNVILLELLIDDLVVLARNLPVDGRPAIEVDDIRQRVAELAVEVEVAKAFIDDHVERLVTGDEQPGDAVDREAELRRDLPPVAGLWRRAGRRR